MFVFTLVGWLFFAVLFHFAFPITNANNCAAASLAGLIQVHVAQQEVMRPKGT